MNVCFSAKALRYSPGVVFLRCLVQGPRTSVLLCAELPLLLSINVHKIGGCNFCSFIASAVLPQASGSVSPIIAKKEM